MQIHPQHCCCIELTLDWFQSSKKPSILPDQKTCKNHFLLSGLLTIRSDRGDRYHLFPCSYLSFSFHCQRTVSLRKHFSFSSLPLPFSIVFTSKQPDILPRFTDMQPLGHCLFFCSPSPRSVPFLHYFPVG